MLKNLLNQRINILEKSMEPSLIHGSSIIMRKIILFSIVFVFLFGCGRKNNPEYESKKIESNIVIYL